MIIRKADQADCSSIAHVHTAAVRAISTSLYTPEEIEAWARPRSPEDYTQSIRTKEFYVAVGEGTIVGFGVLNQESREIEAVYVSPVVRRFMNKEEERIEQLEYELVEAFLKRDINALSRILADEFIITDPHGPSSTKEQYLADLEAERVTFKSLVIDEIEVRVIESTAVVTGKATADGRSEDGPYKGQYSFMDVYLRKSTGWQAILSAVNRAEGLETSAN